VVGEEGPARSGHRVFYSGRNLLVIFCQCTVKSET
jgi:uncharacterized Fe-S radical SAM superfamily protein PflX